jgi:triacylglycerol lipase
VVVAVATALHLVLGLFVAVGAAALLANAVAHAGAIVYRRRHPPACALLEDDDRGAWPARVTAGLATFVAEWAAGVLVVLTAPLAWRWPREPAEVPGDQRPIVVLHGQVLHRLGSCVLARRLRRDGWRVHVVGSGVLGGDIERRAARLAAALARLGGGVDVIAHGVGGLVVRVHARSHGRASGVGRLVTLGTPHQGTAALGFGRVAADSALVTRLTSGDPVPALLDCTAIYSADDACIVPASAGYWPGAFNIEVRGLGHLGLLFSRRVYELVRENLDAPPVARSASAAP